MHFNLINYIVHFGNIMDKAQEVKAWSGVG